MDTNLYSIDAFIFKSLTDEFQILLSGDIDKDTRDCLDVYLSGYYSADNIPPEISIPVKLIVWKPHREGEQRNFAEKFFTGQDIEWRIPNIFCLDGASIQETYINNAPLPRQAKYMDSSIWNYCIWGNPQDKEEIQKRVNRILKSIYNNWDKGYYLTSQGVEYVDFNARLSMESYLIGNQHSNAVSPFLFHSETLARNKMSTAGKDVQSRDFCCGYKWRFLLIDDFAEDHLNSYYDEKSSLLSGFKKAGKTLPSKLDVIIDRLTSIEGITVATRKAPIEINGTTPEDSGWKLHKSAGLDTKVKSEDVDIVIEYVTSLADCEKLIGQQHKQFDIVLLDYLLGSKINSENEDEDDDDDSREYGYELLSVMNEWDNNSFGPGHRLYFMFITSFVHTVQERLEEQFLTRSTEKWYIGRGACPLNTPEIFLYNLHSIMKKRCSTLINLEIETDSGQSEKCIGKERIPTGLFPSRANDDFPRYCRERFRSLLNFVAEYRRLCDNDLTEYVSRGSCTLDSKDSRLARSIVEKENIQSVEFWEHFQHLYYLIAYEPKSRWPEWWEEYTILSNLVKEDESANGQKYTDMLNVLRDYIVKVSKQF